MTTLEERAPEAFGVLKDFIVECFEDDGEEFMDLTCGVCEEIAGHYQCGAPFVEIFDDLVEHVEKTCKGPAIERPDLRIVGATP